eukprot:GSMAST32.ASY1.ANO1.975.1 assembled CDS
MLDLGEDVCSGAVREVFEETGISTNFQSILAFWQRHGLVHGKSDIYAVTRLSLKDDVGDSRPIINISDELSDCKNIGELASTSTHPLVLSLCNMYSVKNKYDKPIPPKIQMYAHDLPMVQGKDTFTTFFPSSENNEYWNNVQEIRNLK